MGATAPNSPLFKPKVGGLTRYYPRISASAPEDLAPELVLL
jgi:hypothetical protein